MKKIKKDNIRAKLKIFMYARNNSPVKLFFVSIIKKIEMFISVVKKSNFMKYCKKFYNLLTDFSSRHTVYMIIIAIIVLIFFLLPITKSGFLFDDATNSLLKGNFSSGELKFWDTVVRDSKIWLNVHHRLMPLSVLQTNAVFYIFCDRLQYKIFLITLLVINVILFGYFVKLLTNSSKMMFLAVLLPSIFFQFYRGYDAILYNQGLLQTTFIYCLISFILLIGYLKKNNKIYYLLSVFFYLLSMLTYEITYVFFILYILLIFLFADNKKWLNVIKLAVPYILSAFSLMLFVSLFRIKHGVAFSGGTESWVPNLDFKIYFSTLLKQLSSGLPLSYFIFNPSKIFDNPYNYLMEHFSLAHIILISGYASLFIIAIRNLLTIKLSKKIIVFIAFFGLLLFILSAAMIASAPGPQQGVEWGIGYLPVYVSYYGMMMMVIAAIYSVCRICMNLKQKFLSYFIFSIVVICFCAAVIINYNDNNIVIEKSSYIWRIDYSRIVVESALKKDIAGYLGKDPIVIVYNNPLWGNEFVFNLHSKGKIKNILTMDQIIKNEDVNNFAKNSNIYYLIYDLAYQNGFALFGKINNIKIISGTIRGIYSNNIYLYVSGYKDKHIEIAGYILKNNKKQNVTINDKLMSLISHGSNWRIYNIVSNDVIDLSEIQLFGK